MLGSLARGDGETEKRKRSECITPLRGPNKEGIHSAGESSAWWWGEGEKGKIRMYQDPAMPQQEREPHCWVISHGAVGTRGKSKD